MTTAFALRVLMDVSLYLCAASFFGALLGQTAPLAAGAVCLSLMAGASFAMRRAAGKRAWLARLWWLPIAGIAAAFWEPVSLADYCILVPAAVYGAIFIARKPDAPDYASVLERFALSWKILLGVSALLIVTGQWAAFSRLSAPNAFLCLISALMLLRMLRQDEKTLRQTSFRIRNDLTVGLVALSGLVMSTRAARAAFTGVLKGIWLYGLLPILRLMVYLAVGLASLIGKALGGLFSRVSPDVSLKIDAAMEELDLSALMREADETGGAGSAVAINIAKGLGALIAIALIVLLFRYLMRNRRRETRRESADLRESLSEALPANPLIDLPPKDDRERTRWYYRRYMALSIRRGAHIQPSMTTKEIRGCTRSIYSGALDALDEIREAYLPARYRAADGDARALSQAAKQAYAKLRAAKPQ